MRKDLTGSAAALVMVWSAIAQAQVPRGTGGTDSGGAAAANPAAAAPAPAPAAATSDTAPAEVAPQPPTAPAPEAAPASPAVAEPAEEAQPPRRKRPKKKRRYVEEDELDEELDEAGDEDDEDGEDGEDEPSVARGARWKLRGPHFVISAERLTSILSWSQGSKSTGTFTDPATGTSFTSTNEGEESGTDVSLLSAGGFLDNPFSLPRVGFDYMFSNGLTIGGSLSYVVTSGESEDKDSDGTTRTEDRPTVDIFLLAPRLGMFLGATPKLGIWLRGGITRWALSSERDRDNGDGTTTRTTYAATLVAVTLDPQLVISPVPHVGITVGPTLDIGVSGSAETTGSSSTSGSVDTELTASSYGVTAGLVAMF
jgi:hypothetical protein